jgi:hypothetical protein
VYVVKDGNRAIGEIAYIPMGRCYQVTLYVDGPDTIIRLGHLHDFEDADTELRKAHKLKDAIDATRFYAKLKEQNNVVGHSQ